MSIPPIRSYYMRSFNNIKNYKNQSPECKQRRTSILKKQRAKQ